MSDLASIVKARGGRLSSDAMSALIPAPGHSNRDRSVSLRLTEHGRILIYCFSATNWRDVRDELIADGLATLREFQAEDATPIARISQPIEAPCKVQPRPPVSLKHAQLAWSERTEQFPKIVQQYLAARGLGFLEASSQIGAHPNLALAADPDKQRRRAPCLLARLSTPEGGFSGVQATFLFDASRPHRKLRLTYGRARHAGIRLGEPDHALLIGEGLESTLSASRIFNLPAVATLSAVNLADFEAPCGLHRLIIAADNDASGREAAETCRSLNRRNNLEIEIVAPGSEGEDWNDVWRAARHE